MNGPRRMHTNPGMNNKASARVTWMTGKENFRNLNHAKMLAEVPGSLA